MLFCMYFSKENAVKTPNFSAPAAGILYNIPHIMRRRRRKKSVFSCISKSKIGLNRAEDARKFWDFACIVRGNARRRRAKNWPSCKGKNEQNLTESAQNPQNCARSRSNPPPLLKDPIWRRGG